MRKAFELAEKFLKDFSKRNQIFVTTHSPAFYSLDYLDVSKWEVKKSIDTSDDSTFSISDIYELKKFNEVDESLGVTVLVAKRAKEIYTENARLNDKLDYFRRITRPIVLCEGKTDVTYITKSLELYRKSELLKEIEIIEANQSGKGSGSELLKAIKRDRKDRPNLYHTNFLLVFDCDVKSIQTETVNAKTKIFKFIKQESHPFESGIENALSIEVAELINRNEKYWSTRNENKGHKKTQITEFKKVEACEFVCSRNNLRDFLFFELLIKEIEDLILNI